MKISGNRRPRPKFVPLLLAIVGCALLGTPSALAGLASGLAPRSTVVQADRSRSRRRARSRATGPVTVRTWRWVDASRLIGRSDRRGEAAYVTRLQRQQAHGVLERLSVGLNALR
jgi:hypothetical protein